MGITGGSGEAARSFAPRIPILRTPLITPHLAYSDPSAPRAIALARVADGRTDPQEVLVGEAAAVEEQRVPRADVPQHMQEAHLRSQYGPALTGTPGYSWVLTGIRVLTHAPRAASPCGTARAPRRARPRRRA